jgi:hypothetical protein
MIIMDVAEWIANFFILGIATVLWLFVVFGIMMISSIIKRIIRDLTK